MVPFFVERLFGKGMGKQKKRQDKDQPFLLTARASFHVSAFFFSSYSSFALFIGITLLYLAGVCSSIMSF